MSAHTSQTELKLIGKLILEGEMTCETGLHVGAGKGSLEIGGSDNPVVKDAFGRPYVPGSSLRGKIRSLLEQSSGLAVPAELVYLSPPQGAGSAHPPERPSRRRNLPAVRPQSRAAWSACRAKRWKPRKPRPRAWRCSTRRSIPKASRAQMRENLDDELTEVKSENAIDRITSQANPRTLERVPAGARFQIRLVMDVLCEEDAPLFLRVLEGLRLLEDDALGGGGSRGSGRVELFQSAPGVARQELLRFRRRRKRRSARAPTLAAIQTAVHGIRFRLPARGVMNPARNLVHRETARPSGPWRIGPDSGARNRVDPIYHSDSLYAAVTAAMARLGCCEEWLDATARRGVGPAVRFSSCFPFLDEIGFVVPPRTRVAAPSPALLRRAGALEERAFRSADGGAALLAGRRRWTRTRWSVDGASECLVPAGKPGPVPHGVRWNAAVDRLTGIGERHSTACLEFRAGRGPVDHGFLCRRSRPRALGRPGEGRISPAGR